MLSYSHNQPVIDSTCSLSLPLQLCTFAFGLDHDGITSVLCMVNVTHIGATCCAVPPKARGIVPSLRVEKRYFKVMFVSCDTSTDCGAIGNLTNYRDTNSC